MVEVLNVYRKFAENYYRKDGQVTSEYGCIKDALKIVRKLYGRKIANDFGPLALKTAKSEQKRDRACVGIGLIFNEGTRIRWHVGKRLRNILFS